MTIDPLAERCLAKEPSRVKQKFRVKQKLNLSHYAAILYKRSLELITLGGIFMEGFYVAGLNNGGDKYGGFCGKTVKLYR